MKIKDTQIISLEIARQLGLSTEEYQHICRKLERTPTYAEAGVFSAMFSEHCSYKSSKPYFKRFPTAGRYVLQGPGENAGVIDIGSGWAIAFKMESHNHPSFIEPYQGAATGVGGILRDIFTMGARPIASMNSLCFGRAEAPRMKGLVKGVVKGIGDYGNCVGVPTVAGQVFFHPCYDKNILVNAFTLGILKHEDLHKGIAKGTGNWMVYVGSKTGRDGVHGATMASQEFSSDKEAERPTVQVGDPFTEKLLLEASLEVMKAGLVVGIQDMGAAGLTSSSFEMAHRAKAGLELDLDQIPVRETGMSGYELLLSESQERMLLVCEPAKFAAIEKIFAKWDLHAVKVGEVVEGHRVKMTKAGEQVVDLPVELVVDPLFPERAKAAPTDLRQRWFMDRNRMLVGSLDAKFEALFEDINIANPTPLIRQYDSTVGNRTADGVLEDAAIMRIREIEGKQVRLALSVDCNPKVAWLSPREGGRRAVAEAAINLAMKGAEGIGITDCLNFGSPENPEVMWQFEEAIEGISEACEALKIPVVSGNVSFYNDTDGKPVYPTPMIGMVGKLDESQRIPKGNFYSTDLEIALLGIREGGLGGSSLASQWFKRDCGKPDDTDLASLERMIRFCMKLGKKRMEFAMHDISDGGMVTALAEMAFKSPHVSVIGMETEIPRETDIDGFLFGETMPRVLVAYEPSDQGELETFASQCGVQFTRIGKTTDSGKWIFKQGGAIILERKVADLQQKWHSRWNGFFE